VGRIEHQPAERGSQRWLQTLVNQHPDLLTAALIEPLKLPRDAEIKWLSPRMDDGYAEYRDNCFLEKLGIELSFRPLHNFWPRRGPVWDGLGRSTRGDLIVIEAKSHIPELVTNPTAARGASLTLIQTSLNEAKLILAPSARADWSQTFYQYTNRLAHLYLLRHLNKHPVYLVFIHFTNDDEMGGPGSREQWVGALDLLKTYLGIRHTPLEKFVVDLFFDVRSLLPQA